MRRINPLVAMVLLAAGAAHAEMVTARWGAGGTVQHPGTLKYEPAGTGGGTVMVVDLSALPKGAKVYGARLFFYGSKWNDVGFDIVPVGVAGEAAKTAGPPLKLVEPFFQWFDAAAAVRASVKGLRSGCSCARPPASSGTPLSWRSPTRAGWTARPCRSPP
jgi:hypothetical protein